MAAIRTRTLAILVVVAFAVTFGVVTWWLGMLRWDDLSGFSCPLGTSVYDPNPCELTTWWEAALWGLLVAAVVAALTGGISLFVRDVAGDQRADDA